MVRKITKFSEPEVLRNIVVTFIEGFLASFILIEGAVTQDVLVGAAAGGLSAVYNLIIKPILRK